MTKFVIGVVIEGDTSITNGVKSVSDIVVLGSPVTTRGEASVPFTITGGRACIVTGASIRTYIVIGAMFGPSIRPGAGNGAFVGAPLGARSVLGRTSGWILGGTGGALSRSVRKTGGAASCIR